jgi:hypothetical protein
MVAISRCNMQKILWHYFCRNFLNDRYTKYLLISIHSLITIGKVNPQDILVSLDAPPKFHNPYLQKIMSYGVDIAKAPIYKNHSKATNLCRVIKNYNDADKVVQIDCDTLITDSDIISKISNLDGAVNHTTINWPITKVFESRDGMKHPTFGVDFEIHKADHSRNLLFSIRKQNQARYNAFKDFMQITFDMDLESTVEKLKSESRMFVGYAFVLSPKIIPEKFVRFISILDLFFGDDEMIFTLAREYSGLEYFDINRYGRIVTGAVTMSDFHKYKGIVHFPVKDDLIVDDIETMIQGILND